MTIEKNKEGEKLTIALGGRLDTTTAPELEEVINTSLDDVKDLVIDLSDMNYVSSAGLRVFLTAQKTMNRKGGMLIRGVGDELREIFEVTGFDCILNIED